MATVKAAIDRRRRPDDDRPAIAWQGGRGGYAQASAAAEAWIATVQARHAEIAAAAAALPRVREAALFLAGDLDLAWRLFALALLAEELAEEGAV